MDEKQEQFSIARLMLATAIVAVVAGVAWQIPWLVTGSRFLLVAFGCIGASAVLLGKKQ